MLGIGWAGGGIGLGAFALADSYLWGQTLFGVAGNVSATLAVVAGLSVPVYLGPFKITIGGDVRPMVRVRAPLSATTAFSIFSNLGSMKDVLKALNSAPAFGGLGVAMDVGTIVELDGLSLGVSARDVGNTTFAYTQSSVGVVINSLTLQKIPGGKTPSDQYVIPMEIAAGLAYHPDFGSFKWLADPTIHVDLDNIEELFQQDTDFWTLLHAGIEAKVLTVFSVQTGLDQGYLTAGLGIHVVFLDANVAFFTRELGQHLGDRPSSGLTVEAAFRL